jgi:ribosome-binding protein aMBF1 (putative translation factor)
MFDSASNTDIIKGMILENIAKAIEKSGKSRYRIAKDTGIDNAVLCRIVSGGSCSIETADILCKYLGLTIAEKKKAKKRAR